MCSLSDQVKTLKVFHVFYVENFAPLLLLILLIADGAARHVDATSWSLGWPVYVPAARRAVRVRDGARDDALCHAVRAGDTS